MNGNGKPSTGFGPFVMSCHLVSKCHRWPLIINFVGGKTEMERTLWVYQIWEQSERAEVRQAQAQVVMEITENTERLVEPPVRAIIWHLMFNKKTLSKCCKTLPHSRHCAAARWEGNVTAESRKRCHIRATLQQMSFVLPLKPVR